MTKIILWCLAVVGAHSTFAAPNGKQEITLPPETAFLKATAAPGYPFAMASCVICHSADYIRTQPPMAAGGWKAEVLKMKKVYGAPVVEAQADALAEYLAQTYGTGSPAPAARP